jgi:hypothetical protein
VPSSKSVVDVELVSHFVGSLYTRMFAQTHLKNIQTQVGQVSTQEERSSTCQSESVGGVLEAYRACRPKLPPCIATLFMQN